MEARALLEPTRLGSSLDGMRGRESLLAYAPKVTMRPPAPVAA